jgi:RNA polymerase sigma-70 factor (ECF subfamily)
MLQCVVSTIQNPPTDGELASRIASARTGRDHEAEALLCRRLGPRIRLYGLRHLRDPHAANDLVQEVLLLTLQRLREGSIRDPEQIASFVLGTSRQMVIDGRRNQQRRGCILEHFIDGQEAETADAPPLDEEALRRCLEHLPARERSVVLMTFYDDHPADRIAQELGTSSGNVRVIRHRALLGLRRCMGGTMEMP